MSDHNCIKENEWGEVTTTLKSISDRFLTHVVEGEKQGGHRDRLVVAEMNIKYLQAEIAIIKKGYWIAAIVGGLIGGLAATSIPELFSFLLKCLT